MREKRNNSPIKKQLLRNRLEFELIDENDIDEKKTNKIIYELGINDIPIGSEEIELSERIGEQLGRNLEKEIKNNKREKVMNKIQQIIDDKAQLSEKEKTEKLLKEEEKKNKVVQKKIFQK